jgi:uncharacterized membrane protein YgdD (TMEM256/DUF423 family)
MMAGQRWITVAAMLGLTGVMLGAFGAHWLNDTGYLEKKYAESPARVIAGFSVPASYGYLRNFETAVQYQLIHASALLACGVLMLHRNTKSLRRAAWCFTLGISIFSGSLYLLVMAGPRWAGIPWGAIVPIGGTLLLLGWFLLIIETVRWRSPSASAGESA